MADDESLKNSDADPTVITLMKELGLSYTRENYLEALLFGLEDPELEEAKSDPEILSMLPEDLRE